MKVLTKQVIEVCKVKKVIPVTWFICMVTKTYTILFSTFWLLFILSKTDSTEEAETIYQYVMIVSIICGVAFVPIVGKLADTVSPAIMLPAATGCRFLSIVCFCFI